MERLLGQLEGRCKLMLQMQKEVKDATVDLHKGSSGKKLDDLQKRALAQGSNLQADKETEIVIEADKAIGLIKAEGSAVAFAEVFDQVRRDMKNVETNLKRTDVGVVTQAIEDDIISTLEDMIKALKKAQQDNKNKPKPPPPPKDQPPPKPADPKLIDGLAELKMIASMQNRINQRTKLYGEQYKGEQLPSADVGKTPEEQKQLTEIRDQFEDLTNRQSKLGKVAHDIATGKNEKR